MREVAAVEPRMRGLAALLVGCARGEPDAGPALLRWDGGRLRHLVARMLDDPDRVDAVLERLLADLTGGAGAFRGDSDTAAQDWLFARMRHAVRASGGMPAFRVTPEPAPAPAERELDDAPAEAWAPAEAAGYARLRPASGSGRAGTGPQRTKARLGRGLVILFLLAAAAAAGLAASLVGLRWRESGERPFAARPVDARTEADIAAPPPAEPVAPPVAAPAPATPDLGPPIAAREPPVTAAPRVPAPPPPAEEAVPDQPRLVIHHGTDEESAALARQLAGQLRAAGYGVVEIRAVPFNVATASVRYFFTEDRAEAERLIRGIGPFLAWNGRAAPSTPIGFTDFRPLPRPGTLEIWLPRR